MGAVVQAKKRLTGPHQEEFPANFVRGRCVPHLLGLLGAQIEQHKEGLQAGCHKSWLCPQSLLG